MVRVTDRGCGCHEVSKKEMCEGWLKARAEDGAAGLGVGYEE